MSARTRLLSIQNNPADQRLLLAIMQRLPPHDIALTIRSDPDEALVHLRDFTIEPPNLIRMNWHFPLETGLRLLTALKSDVRLRAVPVVVISSFLPPVVIQQIYNAQAACVLESPQDFHELEELVNLLRRYWLNTARLPYRQTVS